MGKIKTLIVAAAAISCPILAATPTDAGNFIRKTAFASAGIFEASAAPKNQAPPEVESLPEIFGINDNSLPEENESSAESAHQSETESAPESEKEEKPEEASGVIIVRNRANMSDETDFSLYTEKSGAVYRYNYGKFSSADYITLKSGAQVRNCTEVENSALEKASEELPAFHKSAENSPRVLIYHTHATESFLPEGDFFDASYPIRSPDYSRNMVAVGDALCEALSKRGISSVHDCARHDYPMYTGAYYRSAESMQKILDEFPDIDIIIDLHRDGIINPDGSLTAPVCEINGKSAAQFMIISCCDSGDFDMPDYIENFKLACLLQDRAETLYPSLARPVLFDYRNYNQSLSTGALLIEVGSHGNSLAEAVYTGELLGEIIASALLTR